MASNKSNGATQLFSLAVNPFLLGAAVLLVAVVGLTLAWAFVMDRSAHLLDAQFEVPQPVPINPADLKRIELPDSFRKVDSTYGCATDKSMTCFVTGVSTKKAVAEVADAIAATKQVTLPTRNTMGYQLCGSLGTSVAHAIVMPRLVNPDVRDGELTFPEEDPVYDGQKILVSLTQWSCEVDWPLD